MSSPESERQLLTEVKHTGLSVKKKVCTPHHTCVAKEEEEEEEEGGGARGRV